MGAEVTGAFDAADAFEAETIPDAYGRGIGLVNKVKDGVCVTLEDGEDSEHVFCSTSLSVFEVVGKAGISCSYYENEKRMKRERK